MSDRRSDLLRALLAEALGTAGLLMVVVGSGIMAAKLSPGNAAVVLLANSLATGCGLFVLITVFAPVSGAHFNPVVSAAAWCDGRLAGTHLAAYMLVQILAALAGTFIVHAMFDLDLAQIGEHSRGGTGALISEGVATAGLLLVIRGMAGKATPVIAAGVGAYITAAYWFTASTAFANPAATLGRSITTTYVGIAPADVPGFILAQCAGGVAGYLLNSALKANRSP